AMMLSPISSLRGLGVLLLVAAVVSCGGRAPATGAAVAPEAGARDAASESARLNVWLDARFEEEPRFSPIFEPILGRKTDYDKIDDVSEAADDMRLAWREESVAELKRTFDYARLTPEAKTSYDLWVYGLDREEKAKPFRRREYVFTQMDGPHT